MNVDWDQDNPSSLTEREIMTKVIRFSGRFKSILRSFYSKSSHFTHESAEFMPKWVELLVAENPTTTLRFSFCDLFSLTMFMLTWIQPVSATE